jgi:hypothetical protein
MNARSLLMAVATGLALTTAGSTLADHRYTIAFYATIESIEGAAPFGVEMGGQIVSYFEVHVERPDSDPSPGRGEYNTAMHYTDFDFTFGPHYHGLGAGPITVIDNSALGDVYRAVIPVTNTTPGVLFELMLKAVSSRQMRTRRRSISRSSRRSSTSPESWSMDRTSPIAWSRP